MVVDDEPDIVMMVRLMLELDGYEVLEAGTGEHALEVLQQQQPDALRLPVIMISAHSTESTSQEALSAGCRGFLSKPFESDELLELLERVITSVN
jgi:two-component system, NtrC family, response regulator GlrR